MIVPPPVRKQAQDVFDKLFSQEGGTRSTNENVTKDGGTVICEWFNTPLTNGNGEVTGVSSFCQDITERRKAAAEIENLAAFPRFNPDAIMQFSADGNLIYSNDAALQLARSHGKMDVPDILPGTPPPSSASASPARTTRSSAKPRWPGARFRGRFSRSPHSSACIATPRRSPSGSTWRRNCGNRRRCNPWASSPQASRTISTTSLRSSRATRNWCPASADLPESAKESLDQVALAAQRAANLTRQLLTFGRKQFMQVELLDLNEVIKSVTQMLRRGLGENITLRCNLSTRLPNIEADSTMMEQVIMNLSLNARDAMAEGGSLIITTNPAKVGREYVDRNPEAREGLFVCLTVSDNGCGMDRIKLGKIFEPFFTTKEVGKGTGLGLATVYGIVKQHTGWIEVESEPGKGTAFKIFLPSSGKTITSQVVKGTGAQVKGGKETILLVEDEPGVLSLARGILKSYGYKVLEAQSGVEALRVWAQYDTHINLLLTDMVMPGGMSGYDLAKKLRGEKQDLKVIYTSGYSMETLGQDFTLGKGMLFLKKPYQPQTLAQYVRECLDSVG